MKTVPEFDRKAKLRKGCTKGSKYSGRPRRPLTSYNIFFANERKKIIREQQQWQEQGSNDHAAGQRTLRLKVNTANRGRANVGFAGLAHYVSQKWKTVCNSYKMELEELARLDKIRYDKEMRDWRLKLKFDDDPKDQGKSKFDDYDIKIEEDNKKDPIRKTEADGDHERTLSFPQIYPVANQKVLSGGMQENVSADIKESLTQFHEESPKCPVKSDYESLPCQVSFNRHSSISMMGYTDCFKSYSNIQPILNDPSTYLCHPCNETTDPLTCSLPGLSCTGQMSELGMSSLSSFQYCHDPCNMLGNQEKANFTEMSMPMSYDDMRIVPTLTAGSQIPLRTSNSMTRNIWDQGSSLDGGLEGCNYSNNCEESLHEYSFQDIQRFFGIEPGPGEK